MICVLSAISLVSTTRIERKSPTECAYMSTKLVYGSGAINASQVPSVSPVCIQVANDLLAAGIGASAAVAHGICIAQCQALYDLIESCFGKASADFHFDLYCGTTNGTDCLTVRHGPTYTQLASTVTANCGPANATSCTGSCVTSLQSIKAYSGCCGLNNQQSYNACNITLQAPCGNSLFGSGIAVMTSQFTSILMILMSVLLL